MRINSIKVFFTLIAFVSNLSCNSQNEQTMKDGGNNLVNETSPYLLQHAYNPVNWYPWGDEALALAREQDKMILISIGYSACHWCHVMEHESFEDDSVAKVMNENFICIKVDREERPDIDQIYMSAVQLMTGRGGWPLNCFALPDGRPFFGGTYFPKDQWIGTLNKLTDVYQKEKSQLEEYAEKLSKGIGEVDFVGIVDNDDAVSKLMIDESVSIWSDQFDNLWGGPDKAPKFPLPNNYEFLMYYAHQSKNTEVLNHVFLTLDKMASRGIYDLVGGGFARYSTDATWKVPHFEKMLYDNAQLITLYSKAYQLSKDENYKNVVYQSVEFVERELKGKKENFYSALDADSEGEEGKYYVWTIDELKKTFNGDLEELSRLFLLDDDGYWEHENYILMLNEKMADQISEGERKLIIDKLMDERGKRIRPGLDDKSLVSWNAMMAKAYIDAYFAFEDEMFLTKSLKNTEFILDQCRNETGGLNHSWKNGTSKINGYLEDYAFVIELLIGTYEATLEKKYLFQAKEFTEYVFKYFSADNSSMFYFTSSLDPALVSRKMETQDNVIPSSNSVMAKNLFLLGTYFEISEWRERSNKMLRDIAPDIPKYGSAYSNWLILSMWNKVSFQEIVVCSDDALNEVRKIRNSYLPGILVAGTKNEEYIPLLENRMVSGTKMFYVCENSSCRLPVDNREKALEMLR